MFEDGRLMAVSVWRMMREVAEHLVEAVHDTAMNRARFAEALLIAALWSKKHREFQMPHELNNKAPLLVRDLGSDGATAGILHGLAEITGDENLKIVLKQKAPLTKDGENSPLINQVGRAAMMLCGRLAAGDPSVGAFEAGSRRVASASWLGSSHALPFAAGYRADRGLDQPTRPRKAHPVTLKLTRERNRRQSRSVGCIALVSGHHYVASHQQISYSSHDTPRT
jgi:hypothetical protein